LNKIAAYNYFDKIWIIESLGKSDLKSGAMLAADLHTYFSSNSNNLDIEHKSVRTKTDILNLLKEIQLDTKAANCYPVLHFECHGCPEGLITSSNELVTWESLREILIDINIACRLHLLVTLAACNGIHLMKTATKLDRAPFWAIVGSDREITHHEALKGFAAFYYSLLNNSNGDAAIDELNRATENPETIFFFKSSLGLFATAYRKYEEEFCGGQGLQKRLNVLLSEALKSPTVKAKGVNWARRYIKNTIRSENPFEAQRDRFFMLDLYPENADRFAITRDEIMPT